MRALWNFPTHSTLRFGVLSRRYSHGACSNVATYPPPVSSVDSYDLNLFREHAFVPERPLLVRKTVGQGSLPALGRWFHAGSLSPHLDQFAMVYFPYELMMAGSAHGRLGSEETDALAGFCSWLESSSGKGSDIRHGLAGLLRHHCFSAKEASVQPSEERLVQLHAPLALLLEALQYNKTVSSLPASDSVSFGSSSSSGLNVLTRLYIAQASLSDLPDEMRRDLPTPDPVKQAGRGDVYDTSLWLGLEPTYTPWHRDPNPNIFCQLCSRKTVRLAPPRAGEHVFRHVREEMARKAKGPASAVVVHSRIRGEEMMQGPERQPLHDAIWMGQSPTGPYALVQEARLDPGDMLFIPKGWWHSVKSGGADGRLNASVNWWFR